MNEQTIGRYQILEKVGRGGMGILYRGTDPVLDREVAIKVMSGEFSEDDQDARGRFYREARAAARLQHRNIVTVFEFAEQDGVPYIVMEFLRGRSLSKRMATDPPLALDETLDIMTQLCTGLQFAHENGVVHRDVKPANVWLLDDGGVKLLDFGIAKVAASTFTRQGDVLGSACYMAPEQVGGKPVDGRADIFSAGVVLYELLARRKPFDAESPTAALMKIMQEDPEPIEQIVPGLPAALIDALNRALKKDPEQRYQTAGDFGADLRLVRMALQGAGTKVPGAEGIGDTLRTTGTSTRLAVPGTGVTRGNGGERAAGAVAAPPSAPRLRPIFIGAGIIVVAAIAWMAVTLSRSHPTVPEGQAAAPVTREPAAAGVPQPAAVSAAAATVRAVTLHVVSDPPGAAITVDGRAAGVTTPADVRLDPAAAKRLRLTKDGYRPGDVRLSQRIFSDGAVSVVLQAADAVEAPAAGGAVKVTITGSYPFEVYEGGRQLSPSGTAHELTVPSSRVIRLRSESYLLDVPVKVAGGADRTMEVRAPELGRVTIRGMETCRVSLGSFDLGYPPINGQAVAAGTYSVQLKCPDGQVLHSPAITVIAGQSVMVKVP